MKRPISKMRFAIMVDFIYHVSRFTEAIPTIVNNKTELRLKLNEKPY